MDWVVRAAIGAQREPGSTVLRAQAGATPARLEGTDARHVGRRRDGLSYQRHPLDITAFGTSPATGPLQEVTAGTMRSSRPRHRGRISKQGSRLVRWAAVEAVQRVGKHTYIGGYRDRITARRGRNIGNVAAARELVEYVYYALRDGTCRRALTPAAA